MVGGHTDPGFTDKVCNHPDIQKLRETINSMWQKIARVFKAYYTQITPKIKFLRLSQNKQNPRKLIVYGGFHGLGEKI